jgi:hypothetical protein
MKFFHLMYIVLNFGRPAVITSNIDKISFLFKNKTENNMG